MKTGEHYFKLRYRLILIFIVISLVPILVLSYYLTTVISRNSMERSLEIYSQSTRQLTQNLLNRLNSYYTTATEIAYNKNVIDYLAQSSEDDMYIYEYYNDNIKPLVDKVMTTGSNTRFRIYTANQSLKFAGVFVRDEATLEKYRNLIQNSQKSINWDGVIQIDGKNYLRFVMPITDYKLSSEIIGILEFIIDLSDLQTFLSADSPDNRIFIMIGDTLLLSSAKPEMDISFIQSMKDKDTINYKGKEYLLAKSQISDNKMNLKNWSICNLISLEKINNDRRKIQVTSILISFFCIFASVLLLFLLSRSITDRVEFLIGRMNEISKGKQNVSVIVPGNDEIAQLSRHFDKMIVDLNALMAQLYESKLHEQMVDNAQKEAQLLALQNQINPHYLFNTMESIRMNLLANGDRETSEIVKLFADSFREMISDTGHMISIGDELEFIKKYFRIQEYRYDNKISLKIDVPAELKSCIIPKFLLQPLIENAVYHGLELKGDFGTVTLSIKHLGQSLKITVSDDGLGISKEELRDLKRSVKSETVQSKNYALRNIFKRLRLLYGEKADFDIESELGKGMDIYIIIPAKDLGTDVMRNV